MPQDEVQRREARLIRHIVQAGALVPWMKALAEWHAAQPTPPDTAETMAMAQQLVGAPLSRDTLTLLLTR